MEQESIKEAPTVEEALDAALEELGVQQDAVEYEVLQRAQGKAKVKVWIRQSYLAAVEAEEEDEDDEEEYEEISSSASVEEGEILSDEELDRIADTALGVLRKILPSFGAEGCSIEEYEGDEGEIILDVVEGGDLSTLIGRHGKTLDALQVLVSAITNRELGYRYPVVVDIEGYRHRRRQKLEQTARQAADRATSQHRPVKLRPMTPYERRIVHVALRNDRRVKTESEGIEPNRLVVVKPR
ncbi:MAG: RNA-binding cell elongation regulator Jag/EloR [Coriobacteriia bacterium]